MAEQTPVRSLSLAKEEMGRPDAWYALLLIVLAKIVELQCIRNSALLHGQADPCAFVIVGQGGGGGSGADPNPAGGPKWGLNPAGLI